MKPSVGTIMNRISQTALKEDDTVLAAAVLSATYQLGAPKTIHVAEWKNVPPQHRERVVNLFRAQCVQHSRQQAEHNYKEALSLLLEV